MENRTQPMEVKEVELVNEVELGDDTITPSIASGVGGSENALDQPLTIDTPPSDPPTLGTAPADSQTLGSALTPADVSSGTNAYEKKHRQKTSKVWDDFSQIEVCGVKKSQCNWCKRLFVVSKSSSTATLGSHLGACVKYVESNNKKQKDSHL